MDIVYYSNYCKHCQKIIQFLAKNNLTQQLNCICIDKRARDPKTNQVSIVLENGKHVLMPPNVHSVPAMLLVKQQFRVLYGDEILEAFSSKVQTQQSAATGVQGEPAGFILAASTSNSNIMSEQYTSYDLTPDDLGARSRSNKRGLYNYVSAQHDGVFINTPPDTYRPDKLSGSVTVDTINQMREQDVPKTHANMFSGGI